MNMLRSSNTDSLPWPQRLPGTLPRQRSTFAGLDIAEAAHGAIALALGRERRSFLICMQLRGRATITSGAASSAIEHGQTFVCAQAAHFLWQPADLHARCMFVSGGPAFSLRFQPRKKLAVILLEGHPVGLLLSDYCARLRSCPTSTEPRLKQKLAEVLADLVDAALEDIDGSVPARSLAARLARAEACLDDPQFDPSALAAECGITLRSLQKRMKALGTTPRIWILERRLERVRRKLDDPSLSNLSIRQIALCSGFSNFSYFIRKFCSAFDVSPGRYRRD